MTIRLIASDIDGTLLGPDHRVSERTIAALRRASDAGVEVVAATGRSHWSAIPLLEPLQCVRWLISSNGASLYDFDAGEVVGRHLLDQEMAADVLEVVLASFPEVGLAWETPDGVFHGQVFHDIRRRTVPDAVRIERPIAELDIESVELLKLMIAHPELVEIEWLDTLAPLLPEGFSVSTSGASFVEVTAPQADKGKALASLCAELGIEARAVAAFGDHSNDLGMLTWARHGYAMANAHPRVQEAAPNTAPHHLDDGVAQIVEALVGR